MEMESSKCRKEYEDIQMDWFVFLPEDILLDILERVPDVFLRYKAKYVCRRWFNIITNRILLDHHSFILINMKTLTRRLVDIREEEEGLQVKEQVLDINHKGRIRSWCNEFVLISEPNNLFVYNLITKEGSYLPQCDASCGGHHRIMCGLALCYDRSKGIYKVVHLFNGRPLQCEILVMRSTGIVSSNWKKIKVPYMIEQQYCAGDPILVEGRYLHWDAFHAKYLISMDVAKEEISQTEVPAFGCHRRFFLSSFVMSGKLANIEIVSSEKAEIWILKDFQNKKWEKSLHSVNVKKIHEVGRYAHLFSLCGVISKRYIILELEDVPVKSLFSYDLKDGVVKELDHIESYDHFVVHSSASFI